MRKHVKHEINYAHSRDHLNLPSFLDVRSINNWTLSDTVSFALSKNLSKKFDKKLTHRLTL